MNLYDCQCINYFLLFVVKCLLFIDVKNYFKILSIALKKEVILPE